MPGANNGIVSVAGTVVGVAAASVDRLPIFTADVAGVIGGGGVVDGRRVAPGAVEPAAPERFRVPIRPSEG